MVVTIPDFFSTFLTLKPYFSPTYKLSYLSKHIASGIKVLAFIAKPPSPFDALSPLPKTVDTIPVLASIFLILSLELSHTNKFPLESNARCSG